MKKYKSAANKKSQKQGDDEMTLDQRQMELEAAYRKKDGPIRLHDAEEWFQANIQDYEK